MTCSWTSSAVTGLKVPMPTWRVTRGGLDAAGGQPLQQLRGEVEPGGRGGDRARLAGEDGLVALPVLGPVRALDVGRQRHVAEALEVRLDRLGEAHEPPAVAERSATTSAPSAVLEAEPRSRRRLAPRASERLPLGAARRPGSLDQQELDAPALARRRRAAAGRRAAPGSPACR